MKKGNRNSVVQEYYLPVGVSVWKMTIALVLFLFHVHVSVLAVSRIRGNDANMVSLSEDLLFDLSKGQCYSVVIDDSNE